MKAYLGFLASKAVEAQDRGAVVLLESLNPCLFPHQADIALWGIRGGARAVFAAFGTGKTLIQIQIIHSILGLHGGSGLIVCPLGVKAEFVKDALRFFGLHLAYVRTDAEYLEMSGAGQRHFITNYERVRDGALDPNAFQVVSLDEASVLRSYGSKTYQTFLALFDRVPFKYVCTATPSPNRFKELIHYAGFLGVMDTRQALTRFFKRDSSSAGNLQLHPHKEREFWLWVSSWATFLNKPSDLGYSDEGYDLPPLELHQHRLPVDHATAGYDSWGQGRLIRNAAVGVTHASREKRDSLTARIERAKAIVDAGPADQHWVIWHDLEDERRAIEVAFADPKYGLRTVYGTQDLEDREQDIAEFSDGRYRILATKPIIAGSGCNFQRHCHSAIYLGIGFKFNDWIQSVHRLQRFLQAFPVDIHVIYTESEDTVFHSLMGKWKQHKELVETMTGIIKEYGLNNAGRVEEMRRSIGIERQVERGAGWISANNDNVMELSGLECVDPEGLRRFQAIERAAALNGDKLLPDPALFRQGAHRVADNSVDLVVTSWPFSDHYEYTESYNDFGHNDGDTGFFEQMDFLSPEIMRVLAPGRMYCVHAKDRIVYGSVSGEGMYTVNPFSDKCVLHLQKHGFRYCGRITVVTDVVRENNQTYRLGWTENSKDGTKMGVGSPEYVLLFRKLPTDQSRSYADNPVVKSKDAYSRARWQFDAHSLWRSDGNRFLRPEEIADMPMDQLRQAWQQFSRSQVYNFGEHVGIAEEMEKRGILPSSFMALDPPAPNAPLVWDDITRMRTLNTEQGRKGWEQHVCPLQIDIVDRLIERYSNAGELVLDPFGGLGTVAYRAVSLGRRGYSIELNERYWRDSVAYCRSAEQSVNQPTLFDFLEPVS